MWMREEKSTSDYPSTTSLPLQLDPNQLIEYVIELIK